MTSIIRGILTGAVLTGTLLLSVEQASADCVRHFYNKSDVRWHINIRMWKPKPLKIKEYNIYVGPKETKRFKWSSSIVGTIMRNRDRADLIVSRRGYRRKFKVVDQKDGDCVYIKHSGNTGKASVNAPANGDLTLH